MPIKNTTQWEECRNPNLLLTLARQKKLATPRKQRLVGCACCRNVRACFFDDRLLEAVILVEQFADGETDRKQIQEMQAQVNQLLKEVTERWEVAERTVAATPPHHYLDPQAVETGRRMFSTVSAIYWLLGPQKSLVNCMHSSAVAASDDGTAEQARQADLVRDIYGNPFRKVRFDRAWLQWRDRTIFLLARRAYDEHDFSLLPILADALEEAGCASDDILQHLRGSSPHVRGCWVLDRLLGKE